MSAKAKIAQETSPDKIVKLEYRLASLESRIQIEQDKVAETDRMREVQKRELNQLKSIAAALNTSLGASQLDHAREREGT